jgi:hypothetical protein
MTKYFTREREFDLFIGYLSPNKTLKYLKEKRFFYSREELMKYHFLEYKGLNGEGYTFGGFTDEAIELAKFYLL